MAAPHSNARIRRCSTHYGADAVSPRELRSRRRSTRCAAGSSCACDLGMPRAVELSFFFLDVATQRARAIWRISRPAGLGNCPRAHHPLALPRPTKKDTKALPPHARDLSPPNTRKPYAPQRRSPRASSSSPSRHRPPCPSRGSSFHSKKNTQKGSEKIRQERNSCLQLFAVDQAEKCGETSAKNLPELGKFLPLKTPKEGKRPFL